MHDMVIANMADPAISHTQPRNRALLNYPKKKKNVQSQKIKKLKHVFTTKHELQILQISSKQSQSLLESMDQIKSKQDATPAFSNAALLADLEMKTSKSKYIEQF